jgi:hypothetical protein
MPTGGVLDYPFRVRASGGHGMVHVPPAREVYPVSVDARSFTS